MDAYGNFCDNMDVAIDGLGVDIREDLLVRQRRQLVAIVAMEREFLDSLPLSVFNDFALFITQEKRNILSARPYFRERSVTFKGNLSEAFRAGNGELIRKYRLNWLFIDWVRRTHPQFFNRDMANKISKERNALMQESLPLAISEAKMFWGATPKSHLSFMDVVQICACALLISIDKFTPPIEEDYDPDELWLRWKSFRAVAIGLMRRDKVNAYSETSLHFYPADRAKIYRALKILRYGELSDAELSKRVNEYLEDDHLQTTPDEIRSLLAAASVVSSEPVDSDDPGVLGSVPDATYSGETLEDKQAVSVMLTAARDLSMLEQKMLKLKGLSC